MDRISSTDTASALVFGSPPSRRTTPLVECDSSQMTGFISVLKAASGGATRRVTETEFCIAIRFGTSSPSTSDR